MGALSQSEDVGHGWGLSEGHRGLRDWVEEKYLVQSWTLSKPLKSADSLRTYIPDIHGAYACSENPLSTFQRLIQDHLLANSKPIGNAQISM